MTATSDRTEFPMLDNDELEALYEVMRRAGSVVMCRAIDAELGRRMAATNEKEHTS